MKLLLTLFMLSIVNISQAECVFNIYFGGMRTSGGDSALKERFRDQLLAALEEKRYREANEREEASYLVEYSIGITSNSVPRVAEARISISRLSAENPLNLVFRTNPATSLGGEKYAQLKRILRRTERRATRLLESIPDCSEL